MLITVSKSLKWRPLVGQKKQFTVITPTFFSYNHERRRKAKKAFISKPANVSHFCLKKAWKRLSDSWRLNLFLTTYHSIKCIVDALFLKCFFRWIKLNSPQAKVNCVLKSKVFIFICLTWFKDLFHLKYLLIKLECVSVLYLHEFYFKPIQKRESCSVRHGQVEAQLTVLKWIGCRYTDLQKTNSD